MFKKVTIALASAALISAPAFAAEEETAPSVGVSYADLDLTTEEGAKELEARIDAAARSICGMDDVQTGTRVRNRESVQCYRDAKRQIDRQFAELIQSRQLGG